MRSPQTHLAWRSFAKRKDPGGTFAQPPLELCPGECSFMGMRHPGVAGRANIRERLELEVTCLVSSFPLLLILGWETKNAVRIFTLSSLGCGLVYPCTLLPSTSSAGWPAASGAPQLLAAGLCECERVFSTVAMPTLCSPFWLVGAGRGNDFQLNDPTPAQVKVMETTSASSHKKKFCQSAFLFPPHRLCVKKRETLSLYALNVGSAKV